MHKWIVYNIETGKLVQFSFSHGPPSVDAGHDVLFLPAHISFKSGETAGSLLNRITEKPMAKIDHDIIPGIHWEEM